ncbi:MAG: M1 family aminopeptidase [Acidobacteriota bacterium]|nr:M1 family aminopeptidase [Acidobacteriota bacterium]
MRFVNSHLKKTFPQTGVHAGWAVVCLMAITLQPRADNLRKPQNDSVLSPSYSINLDLDYREARFTGTEKVKIQNSSRDEIDQISFHLYPNAGLLEEDAPCLSVQRITNDGRELRFNSRLRQTLLKAELPFKLLPGQSLELKLEFSGRLPRIQREEASLLAHFLQEVNDAVSEERINRDSRDIFFASEEAMLLGYFYPVVAVKSSQLAEQSLVAGVGGVIFSDAANYEVSITTDAEATVIGSGSKIESKDFASATTDAAKPRKLHVFKGEKLRGFGLAIVERIKSVEQQVRNTRVVSYFREGDDRLGKRALNIVASALETYSQAFGEYPYPQLQIVELPLPAGNSGAELPSLIAMAQAYYIDFDTTKAARLPSVLSEQADIIKTSFEFSIANGVARQWWGGVVGSDCERSPYLNEGLASYSAVYYHEATYGKPLGEIVLKQQLQGTYQAYRMLGGVDLEADKPVKDFRNPLQFTAIVQAKSALLFAALRSELGDQKFFEALKSYYLINRFRIVTVDQLRNVFLNVADDQRNVRLLFQRWLKEKRGDEDIGAPDLTLMSPSVSKIRALGRVFVKIGKTAAKPF